MKDGLRFRGTTWTNNDGTVEAFWYETGIRMNSLFEGNGDQIGMWKKYQLKFTIS